MPLRTVCTDKQTVNRGNKSSRHPGPAACPDRNLSDNQGGPIMKVAVRYFSRSGNTKKIAEAVAQALGVEAKTVEAPLTEKVDILFLGSSVYAAGVDAAVSEFIKDNADKIISLANFSTAALIPSTYKQVKKIAEQNKVRVLEKEFHCRGKFAVMHAGRPDTRDVAAAKEFAESLVKGTPENCNSQRRPD